MLIIIIVIIVIIIVSLLNIIMIGSSRAWHNCFKAILGRYFD